MTTCGTLRNLLSIHAHTRAYLFMRKLRTCDLIARANVPQRSARSACGQGPPSLHTFASVASFGLLATTIPNRSCVRRVATRPGQPEWHCHSGRVAKRHCDAGRAMGPPRRSPSVGGRGNGRQFERLCFDCANFWRSTRECFAESSRRPDQRSCSPGSIDKPVHRLVRGGRGAGRRGRGCPRDRPIRGAKGPASQDCDHGTCGGIVQFQDYK
jgi:hypothetical protein